MVGLALFILFLFLGLQLDLAEFLVICSFFLTGFYLYLLGLQFFTVTIASELSALTSSFSECFDLERNLLKSVQSYHSAALTALQWCLRLWPRLLFKLFLVTRINYSSIRSSLFSSISLKSNSSLVFLKFFSYTRLFSLFLSLHRLRQNVFIKLINS